MLIVKLLHPMKIGLRISRARLRLLELRLRGIEPKLVFARIDAREDLALGHVVAHIGEDLCQSAGDLGGQHRFFLREERALGGRGAHHVLLLRGGNRDDDAVGIGDG